MCQATRQRMSGSTRPWQSTSGELPGCETNGWHALSRCLSISESTAERYTLADPDVRLMLQVRDNDAQAFEELMLRYQNRLLSLLAHLVGQRDLAEDLTQEVFMRVYRARARYVAGAKFSTWLFTIAGNVASNARRTKSRRREVHLAPASSDTGAQ